MCSYTGPFSMSDEGLVTDLARQLVASLTAAQLTVASAESCTGGWIAKAITDIAGSSGCFGYGVVSYSNAAKQKLLGVTSETLQAQGAVSQQTVIAMAAGVRALSGADLAVAISGVAGPGGGSPKKPVGTVWLAWSGGAAHADEEAALLCRFAGDRDAVRQQAVVAALRGLLERVPGG